MDRFNCNSLKYARPSSSPFKATQLWNEAVSCLQRGMPTHKHFYRMRYYDNCFSGKEAVEWLSRTLTNNPRFGRNVTTEGTRKLLQHFLVSGVFQSVKGSLTFKESGLYEFVDQRIQSPSRKQGRKLSVTHGGLREVNTNVCPEARGLPVTGQHSKAHSLEQQWSSTHVSWKDFILQRIQSQVPTLSVGLLVDPATINSDWVMHNVCPQFEKMRKKTELPFWVFTAIKSVIRPQEKESEYTMYAGFEKDVYSVVRDYLRHCSTPMVPYCLYELVMHTFNHLHYSDLEVKNRLRECDSVENLVLSMSHDWNDDLLLQLEDLTKTVLPPNSCFETAFTSDEPVTRIVPQSSVDTICLKTSRVHSSVNLANNLSRSQSKINTVNSSLPPGKAFGPTIEKSVFNKYKNRKRQSHLRRTQSMAQIDARTKWNTLPLPVKSTERTQQAQQQSYINYGLSQSMDDLLAIDDDQGLDFEAAMQSVNCLMAASCGPSLPPTTTFSDVDSSSLESVSTVYSRHPNRDALICIDSSMWSEETQKTARLVFQSLLMLMSPASRTSLRMLLQFVDQLPARLHSSITTTEMVYDLSAHILSPGPHTTNVYSHHMVLSVVYFLVNNSQHVFQDLPEKELSLSKGECLKENEKVFCEQLTRNQFEDQGVTSSWRALAELLDQIVSDKKMKRKEKKKRLKKFKEEYPHIYKQRFGSSSTNLTNLAHFR